MALLFELVGNLSDLSSSSQGITVSQMSQTTESELCKTVWLNKFSKTTNYAIHFSPILHWDLHIGPSKADPFVFAVLFIPSFDILSMGFFSCFTQF